MNNTVVSRFKFYHQECYIQSQEACALLVLSETLMELGAQPMVTVPAETGAEEAEPAIE